MGGDSLSRLSLLTNAALHEIDGAIAAWESVRPADQSVSVVDGVNRARISPTFSSVRQALHTDVLMALGRLWDRGAQPIGFGKMAFEFGKAEVQVALIARSVAAAKRRFEDVRDARTGSRWSESDPIAFGVWLRNRLPREIENAGRRTRDGIIGWQERYQRYTEHLIRDALNELRAVRDRRLAHWDVADIEGGAKRTYRLHRLGRVLRASELLTEQALLMVRGDHHRFIETHRMYAAEAGRFWAQVSGIRP